MSKRSYSSRFAIAIFFITIFCSLLVTVMAAGVDSTRFGFIDSVKGFFGLLPPQSSTLSAQPVELNNTPVAVPLAPLSTVFADDFSANTNSTFTTSGAIGASAWSVISGGTAGQDYGARRNTSPAQLELTNDSTAATNQNGWALASTPSSGFSSPYNTTLNSNTGLVTWTFNMRQIRTDPAGFAVGSYGVAFLLAGTANTNNSTGSGYAVVLGQSGTTDPVRLAKYSSGVQGTLTNIITSNTAGLTDFGAEYLSVKVTYIPASNTWELFLRNDGASAFVDPLTGSLASQGTAVDNTNTGTSLPLMGAWWQGSTAAAQTAFFDNVVVTVDPPAATPTLNINDVTQAEGDAGQTAFNFTVSLPSPAGAGGVTFNASTADGTTNPATAPSDYTALVNQPGSITAGNTSATVTVQVNGDTTPELNETFFVNITNVVGATAGDVQGLGTISNDDVTVTSIHTIQGSGSTSPLVGNSVTTVGIVTGLKSNGFFMQEPDATVDADPNTSEGIFVFTSAAPPAAAVIGNSVQVTATVQEFIPSQDPTSPPATELITPAVTLNSTGNPLPAPHVITAAETTAPSGTSNPLDSLEEFEGMRVAVPSLTVGGATQGTITEPSATVFSNGVFIGYVTGVARPFREPGIAIADPVPAPNPVNVPRFDENPQRIRVDSDAQPGTTAIDVTAGTVITNITGPLDYGFRVYTIDPDAATPPTVGSQPGSTAVPTATANELTVASFNMERFFDTVNDPATSDPILTTAAFNRRVAKASLIVRTVQRYPDVIGVEEMENLTTLQAVAAQINSDAVTIDALPNPNYTAYLVEGNDIGGIDVGYLVKQSRVTPTSVTQLELAGCDHVTPSTCNNYVDPNTGGLDILNDRPALVLIATIPRPGGGTLGFTVIVNHLRSLSGVDDTTVAGTGTVGARVREKRRKQAEFLANYIQGRQVASATEKIITVGDMNAFRVNDGLVDSIGTILGTPAPANQVVLPSADLVNPNQTDLVDNLAALQQYSYNFDGNTQTLDHIIVNPPALAILTRFAYARNDSDFAVKNYESANELRISDHDQPVAYFDLTGSIPPTPTITPGGPTTFCAGGSVTLTSSSATGNQWYLNGNAIGGAINQNYAATASGNYTVVVTISGSGSVPSAPTTVTVNPLPATPTITAGGPTTFVGGGRVMFTSSSAVGYQWYKNGNLIAGATNQAYVATTSGSYTVVVSSVAGCNSAASLPISVTATTPPTSLVVTKTADTDDGICDIDCSLREAIGGADFAPDTSTITFNIPPGDSGCAGSVCTITLTSAPPDLSANVNINGPVASQVTVQRSLAGPNFSVFRVSTSVTAAISRLTISQGTGTNGNVDLGGGPAPAITGGGIFNQGSLTITSCSITGNSLQVGTAVQSHIGAGVANISGTLSVVNSTLSNNEVFSDFTGGSGATGGGIYNYNGTASIVGSSISGNRTIVVPGLSPTGGAQGGGVYNYLGVLNLTNTTISGNSAVEAPTGAVGSLANGGGVMNVFGTINSTNSTVAANFVQGLSGTDNTHGGGVENTPGGGPFTTGTINLKNTIIARNGFGTTPQAHGYDLLGLGFVSQGNNLIGTTDQSDFLLNGKPTDKTGTDAAQLNPLLGPLGNNGGPTQTQALLPGSPAIDAGDNCILNNTCLPAYGSNITTDQRGNVRPQDGDGNGSSVVDIGAFELTDIPASVVSINRANADPTNASSVQFTVTFSESVSGGGISNFTTTATGTVTGTISSVSGSGATRTVTVSSITGDGTLKLNLANSTGITDSDGAALSGLPFTTGQTYTIDHIPPTVSINQAVGQADPTNGSPINFTVVFSEATTNFATGDVSFTGSTVGGALTGTVTGSGTTYNVAVTGMTGVGTVVASLGAGVATDSAGNNNTASTSLDNTVTFVGPTDLSITKTDGVTSASAGSTVAYTIIATNIGPNPAIGATVTDTFTAAISSVTWGCVGSGGGICAASGTGNINQPVTLPVGGTVTFVAAATISPNATGNLVNTATVIPSIGTNDPNPANNMATDVDAITAPSVFVIDDVSKFEGQTGTTPFVFTVTKTGATGFATAVQFQTFDGTATVANNDYVPTNGTLNFGPTEITKTITVLVNGDTAIESNENFFVRLSSNPINALIGDGEGQGTILNEDPVPTPTPTPVPTPTPTPPNRFEGDINRTALGVPGTGDGDVNVADQIQYLKFLNGTDCPSLSEQPRLDAGPRSSLGDGQFGATDGTAIDAYARHDAATDFDPNVPNWQPTPVGGNATITNLGPNCTAIPTPEGDEAITATATEPEATTADRAVRLVSMSGAIDTDVFAEVELEAQGNEVGIQYSIHFDPAVMSISSVSGLNTNPDVTLGSGAPAGTTLNVNAAGAATGDIGIGQNFNGANTNPATVIPAGTQRIARLKFHILPTAPNGASAVTFTNNPLNRGLFDANGFTIPLPPFTDGSVTVSGALTFSVGGRVTSPNGTGLRSTTVFLTDPNGVRRTATTSSFGFYQFDEVASGVTYTLGVTSRSYRFSTRQITVTGPMTNIDFVGQE